MWYLYIIDAVSMSKKNSGIHKCYTGISTNPIRRFHEHRGHKRYHGKAGWFERMHMIPRRIIYLEKLYNCKTKSDAEYYEKKIKRLSATKKFLLASQWQALNPAAIMKLDKMCKGGL